MKIKKRTRITWKNHLNCLTQLNLKSKFDADEQSRISLVKVEATSDGGAHGQLKIKLYAGDWECVDSILINKKLESFVSRFRSLINGVFLSESTYSFKVISQKNGFCETVVQMVSVFAEEFDAQTVDWFKERIKIEQITFVKVGKDWIEYNQFQSSKYPIRDLTCPKCGVRARYAGQTEYKSHGNRSFLTEMFVCDNKPQCKHEFLILMIIQTGRSSSSFWMGRSTLSSHLRVNFHRVYCSVSHNQRCKTFGFLCVVLDNHILTPKRVNTLSLRLSYSLHSLF